MTRVRISRERPAGSAGILSDCVLILALLGMTTVSCRAGSRFTPPGPNVALGRSYTCEPAPSYSLTTDEGDLVQLTDGVSAPLRKLVDGQDVNSHMIWWHKETVGWQVYRGVPVVVTVDLAQDTPIAGAAFSTGAGFAGVSWPSAVLIAVSQDGKQFQLVGELVHLSGRYGVRPDTGRYVFATDALRCHGRYLRLVIPSKRCLFADEIEIYRGPDELLKQPFAAEPLDDITGYLKDNLVPLVIRNWVGRDLFRARKELAASRVPEEVRNRVDGVLNGVEADNSRLARLSGNDYRSVFPLTGAHRQLLAALGDLRGDEGRPRLGLWKNNRWERLSLWDAPPADRSARDVVVRVRMIRGEKRADTVSIANNTGQAMSARLWFKGLPGPPTPGYVKVHEAEYVAMQSDTDMWDANALPEATLEDGWWQITLPAGVSRQLWFAFRPGKEVKPGRYAGTVVIEPEQGERLLVPLELTVEPLEYPKEHTLALTMWDYAGGAGSYGIVPGNMSAAVAHMRSYGYSVPWLNFFPYPKADGFDAADRLVRELGWSVFDSWVAMWPDARYYAVVIAGGVTRAPSYAGAASGTGQWNRRVGAVLRAWADHVRGLGMDPRRMVFNPVDEFAPGPQAESALRWCRVFRAAVPEFRLFATITHRQPQTVYPELVRAHDFLCPLPHRYDEGGEDSRRFYEELRSEGRELWFYNCAGGPGATNAFRYFRGQEWKLWPANGTGTAFWAYGDVGGSPSGSWNQFAASSVIYSPVYIDASSVADGKHWLAIIEGIEDYEYLRMLRDRVEELEAAGRGGEALKRARKTLDTLPAEVMEAASSGDVDAYDRGRLKALDGILDLARQ